MEREQSCETSGNRSDRGGSANALSIGVTALPMLRTCQRSVALSKSPCPADRLPAMHAFAILGTVFHAFLEKVAIGDSGERTTASRLWQVWRDAVKGVESRIDRTSDSVWLPLSKTTCELERTRLRAFDAAKRLADYYPRHQSPLDGAAAVRADRPSMRGPEIPVRLEVGRITLKGSIDLIVEESGVLAVIDYKTGQVLDERGRVKDEYVEQLRLYAGILERMGGGQADLLVLRDRRGREHRLPIDWQVIDDEVRAAERDLRAFADAWPCPQPTDRDLQLAYPASPSVDNCGRCAFRHRCETHLAALERDGKLMLGVAGRGVESADISGEVERSQRCAQGWSVRVSSPAGRIHLRGLMRAEPRPGDRLVAFGIVPNRPIYNDETADYDDFLIPRWGVVRTAAAVSGLIS